MKIKNIKKYIKYLYGTLFLIMGAYFLVKGVQFFWTFYFAMSIVNLIVSVYYFYSNYRNQKKRTDEVSEDDHSGLKGLIVWLALVYFVLNVAFRFIPGSIGYRPIYTYTNYRDKGSINSVFPDEIPPNATCVNFEYQSESMPGSCIKLYFKIEKEYINSYINTLKADDRICEEEQIIHNQNDRNFTNDFYVYIDEYPEADCCVYYTTKNDKHRDGVAVYNEQNIICFFDT